MGGSLAQFVFSATVEEADGLLLQQPIIIIIALSSLSSRRPKE